MFHWNTLLPALEAHIPHLVKRVHADIRSFRRPCLTAVDAATKKERGADEAAELVPEDTQTRWGNFAFDDDGIA